MTGKGTDAGVAVVLAPGAFKTENAKTAHGLVRGSERFDVVAVLDAAAAGEDAGVALDGRRREIPIVATLDEAMSRARRRPDTVVVGVAAGGGVMPPEVRALVLEAAGRGLHVVNGLHDLASDDPDIAAAAARTGAHLIDLRRPRPVRELHFWSGDISRVRAPRVAVLGTDCALGKRTTARLLVEACRQDGLKAEMVYTGQTGWMQGGRYGFILDSTPNDFVAGELERAVVACDDAELPDVIVLEGQSALRNPSGPCGSELLVSAGAHAVILQHAPGRACFKGHDGWSIPTIEEEIDLIRLYGARVLAIALNRQGITPAQLEDEQRRLSARLALPVVRPLEEGVGALVPLVRRYVATRAC